MLLNAGRYVILVMSLFTMFTGFCYNQFFAKSIRFNSSYWLNQYNKWELIYNKQLQLNPAGETGIPYVYGRDPVWAVSNFNWLMDQFT